MSTELEQRAEGIIDQLLALPERDRAAAAERECAGDPLLLDRVRALLAALPLMKGFMSGATAAVTAESGGTVGDRTAERPGTMIGRYKLLQQIGEGGFGVVYMAEQEVPVKRRVALKVIKAGMDTRAVIARFEAERQALAMMDHPNIARVLDAGATDTGRPYFVMELVKGIPITDYSDQASLDMRQRLELFMDICLAVQHAHQKGIIHRDLKPSNVMVTLQDTKAVVKVIDFGIAKATDQKLTEKTLFTNYGQMIGTPAYMSPEQAVMSALDIDTRSDVYSLGVLLYELLAGSPPFDARTLRSAGFDEMRRIIREEAPSKPSTRISTLAPDLKLSVAARRQVNSQVLSRQLQGDLDWIVLKAIEKDRNRRYESASAFAADIRRHLNSEPVTAGAPGAMYRVRKFVRRNRGPVAAAVTILAVLLAGTAISTWQAIRATQAENATWAEKLIAEQQRNRAEAGENLAGDRLVQVEAKKKQAENQTQIAEAVKDFLENKLLAQTDTTAQADALLRAGESSSGAKLNPTVRELLDRAARELAPGIIDKNFPKQPLVQAEILHTLGAAYEGIGEYQPAIDFLKRSVAMTSQFRSPEHPDTLAAMINLAAAYQEAGKLDLALPLYEQAVRVMKTTPGTDNPATLKAMNDLALAYKAAGRLDLALPLLEYTVRRMKLELGPDHPDTLNTSNSLATAYQADGKLNLAIPLFEETLKIMKARLGPEHPNTLNMTNNLATAYQEAGKLELALPLLEDSLMIMKAKLGPEHPKTLNTMNSLARAYEAAGKFNLALPIFEDALKIMKAKPGPNDPATLITMNNLAETYQDVGRPDLALPLLEETLKIRIAALGLENPDTLYSMNNLAEAYKDVGKIDSAVPLLEETLRIGKVLFGPDHPNTLSSMNNLAKAYQAQGRLDLAIPLFEDAYKAIRVKLGPDHPSTLTIMDNLANAYSANQQFDKAELLYRERLDLVKQKSDENLPAYASGLVELGRNLLDQRKWPAAEPYLRACLTIRQKAQPNVWSTFYTQSLLGGSLLGQQKFADAEPLLLAGYQGMKQREKAIPPRARVRLTEALDRLIELYVATDQPDEVKRWQAERATYPTTAPAN